MPLLVGPNKIKEIHGGVKFLNVNEFVCPGPNVAEYDGGKNMIYGELKDIKNYKGLNKNLDKAIDFIVDKKYLNANFGKNLIEGNSIYFDYPEKVMTRENKDIESEYHKKYADIHIVLEGEEIIGYTSFEDCVETKAYNSEKDIAFVKGENQAEVLLNGKNFALFFPEEVHLPLLKVGEIKEIKKVVFKIEI